MPFITRFTDFKSNLSLEDPTRKMSRLSKDFTDLDPELLPRSNTLSQLKQCFLNLEFEPREGYVWPDRCRIYIRSNPSEVVLDVCKLKCMWEL